MMTELSLHILDIVQNSVKAKSATITIVVSELIRDNIFQIIVEDNGCGIDAEMLRTIKNPFTTSRTMRKVGLGIPFLNETCEQCGGELTIESTKGVGTKIIASMDYNNIDRPPLGNISTTVAGLISSNENIDIIYTHIFNNEMFEISSNQIKQILGEDIPLSNIQIYKWLVDYIKENVNELYIS